VKLSTAQGRREAERQRRIRRLRRRRALRLTAAGAVALGLVAAIGLSLGGRAAQQSGLGGWASAVRNFARAQLAAARVDALRIDIKFKHLHRIHTKRDEALARGVLIAERSDFVPASIALAGPAVPVRLRLIGPEPEHLQRDPWSFEVRVRGDAHIEGMRRFALHAPDLVGGALPLVAALQLERAGLAAPRTSLVEVSLNGDGLGLAVLVELPSAELLRSHGYGAAPVVQLDTRDYWKALGDNARAGPFDNPFTARIIADPEGDEDATATAIGLLRGFLDGALSASEVFDLDATARWLASAELWGDPSCVHWSRARFFLDPLSARLAPIPPLPERRRPLEQDPSEPRGELVAALGELGARLLADSELRHRFARELRALSDQLGSGTGLGGLVAALETRQQQVLLRLHRSAPFSRVVRLAERADRLASLRDIDASRDTWFAPSLARGELSLPSVVAAYAREDEQGAYLDLHNLLPVPVTVSTLRHDDGDGDEATPVTLASRVTFPIQLEPTPLGQPARAVRVRYRQPNVAAVPEAIRGIARIAGDRREYEFLAASSPPPLLTPARCVRGRRLARDAARHGSRHRGRHAARVRCASRADRERPARPARYPRRARRAARRSGSAGTALARARAAARAASVELVARRDPRHDRRRARRLAAARRRDDPQRDRPDGRRADRRKSGRRRARRGQRGDRRGGADDRAERGYRSRAARLPGPAARFGDRRDGRRWPGGHQLHGAAHRGLAARHPSHGARGRRRQ
jgi:hypothetical protein